jgi:hypothetical protein
MILRIGELRIACVGRFQISHDDPGHLVHRLPYAIRLLAIRSAMSRSVIWD